MPYTKKRRDHADSDGILEENTQIDFAWIVFIGLQIGYTEKEISKMYLGKWQELFEHFKWLHNMQMTRTIFQEKKRISLLDL